MRRYVIGLAAMAVICSFARAQPGQSIGVITATEVVVRGTPRSDATDLGTLPQNTTVIVHHAEGDEWLAIQPPRGSVSWVNHKFIRPLTPGSDKFPQNWVVDSMSDVKLAVGRPGTNKPLDTRLTAIPDGTLVVVLGPKVPSPEDNSIWYPIVPPEDDFRYIPKSAVRIDGPSRSGFVVRSTEVKPTPAALSGERIPSPPAPRTVVGSSNPTWQQAQSAEQAGEFDKAEKLYFQLAREMNAPGGDTDLADQCYARIHALRDKRRQPGTTAVLASRTETPKPSRDEQALSKWSGPGSLRATAFRVDGKPAFALESGKQQLVVYAVAGSGVELSRYERKLVDLFGTTADVPELRGVKLMTVTKVEHVR